MTGSRSCGIDGPDIPTLLATPFFAGRIALNTVLNAVKSHRYKATLPNSLPSKRRALSIVRPNDVDNDSSSSLIHRLPLEVRQIIYNHALTGLRLHLVHLSKEKRIGHTKYPNRSSEDEEIEREAILSGGELAFLMTCRRIYIEASHLIYDSNTFVVNGYNNLAAFNIFTRTIRPWRLASITSLSVDIPRDIPSSIPGSAYVYYRRRKDNIWPEYLQMWDTISTKMPSLRDLTVNLSTANMDRGPAYWVVPICGVHGLKSFEIKFTDHGLDYLGWPNGMSLSEPTHPAIKALPQQLKEYCCATDRTSSISWEQIIRELTFPDG